MREKRQQAMSWQSDWALGFPGSSIVHRRRSWLRVAGEMVRSWREGVGEGAVVGDGGGAGVSLGAVVEVAEATGTADGATEVGPGAVVVEVQAASRTMAGRAAKI
jgi:hypothetical protein